MQPTLRKVLLTTIAALVGIIVAIIAGVLTRIRGGHITDAIRDGGVSFAAATTFLLVVMSYLDAL